MVARLDTTTTTFFDSFVSDNVQRRNFADVYDAHVEEFMKNM
jgi:hypothetical protein